MKTLYGFGYVKPTLKVCFDGAVEDTDIYPRLYLSRRKRNLALEQEKKTAHPQGIVWTRFTVIAEQKK